jgi:hypothetical protein
MKKPKPDLLSEEVLRKYLDQSLSPAEMHAVEKAMLDAPLEAEALEGWASVPAASPADLADLRARLRARTRAGTRRLVAPILRAAAAVAVLAVAGWWLWSGTSSEQASQAVATNQAAQADSATLADLPSGEAKPDSATMAYVPSDPPPIERKKSVQPPAKEEARPADELFSADTEQLRGAPVAAEETPKAVLADAKKAPDTLASGGQGQASSESANPAKPKVAATISGPEKNKKIADNPARREAEADQAKAEETGAKMSGNLAKPGGTEQAAQPEGGWPAFRQYVAQAAKPGGAKGTVGLEVSLSARGKVTGAVVVRPLDKARDREAQQLVRRYPGWQPAAQAGQPVASKLVVEVVF